MNVKEVYVQRAERHSISKRSIFKWCIAAPIIWFMVGSLVHVGKSLLTEQPERNDETTITDRELYPYAPTDSGERSQ